MAKASQEIFGQDTTPKPQRRASAEIFGGEAAPTEDRGVYGEVDTSGAPFGMRYRIGEGNTLDEKRNALRNKYPEGDIQNMPVMGLVYRESPADQWKQVNPRGFDRGDIAQFFSQDTGTIAGSIGAAALTRNPSLLGLALKSGAGAAAGELAQQGVQELRGVNEEGIGEIGGRAALKGALDTAGTFALSPLIGARNILTGAGATRVPAESRAAMQAAQDLGLERLPVGSLVDVPFIKTMEQQSRRLAPSIGRQYDELRRGLVSLTESLGGSGAEVRTALDQANRQFTESLVSAVSHRGGVTMSEAGEAIQTAVQAYSRTSQNAVSALYRQAESIAPAQFDIAAPQNAARSLLQDALAPVRRVGPDGSEVVEQVATSPLSPELRRVAETVRDLDFSQGGNQLEVLQGLRTELYDLKTPAMGEPFRNHHRQAKQMYDSLTDALRTPVSDNPAFLSAYERASQAASARFDNLDRAMIITAAKSETPAQLARRLTGRDQVDNIRTLQRVVPSEKFRDVQQAYVEDLLSVPHDIPARLASLDHPTASALMRPADRAALEEVGRVAHSMHRFGIGDILERQSKNSAVLRELMATNDTRRIDNLFTLVSRSGGANGDLGQTIRAGIMDDFAEHVIQSKQGKAFVSDKVVNDYISSLEASGMARFLRPTDVKVMRDIDKVAGRLGTGSDTGASIQAAEQSAQMLRGNPSAYLALARYMGVGRFLTSETGYRVIVGKAGGSEWTQAKMLRAMVAPMVAASLTPDIEDIIRDGN
jgi:hypothetical protein